MMCYELTPPHKTYNPALPRTLRGYLIAGPLHWHAGQLLHHLHDQTLAVCAPHHHGIRLRSRRHGAFHPRDFLRAGEKGCDHRQPDRHRFYQNRRYDHRSRSKKIEETGARAPVPILYYIYYLTTVKGLPKVDGVLDYPESRERVHVELTDAARAELEGILSAIPGIISLESPPQPEKKTYCRKCAYMEFCWV